MWPSFKEAEDILRHATEAGQIARRAARGETGSLGIGFIGAAASPFLPSLVQSYRQKVPDVQLQLYEMTPDQQLVRSADHFFHLLSDDSPATGSGALNLHVLSGGRALCADQPKERVGIRANS